MTILHTGDCLEVMRGMETNSVDSVVTDPPYGLEFMGKGWDAAAPAKEIWAEALQVLKPGGHLLAFGGTRTYHRLACAIEDAGFEIRDQIGWAYGSGFPKSMNVSKAIDKAAGATPVDVGPSPNWRESKRDREKDGRMEVRGANAGRLTVPATDAAHQWNGWGTALKPAWEPICVARKPLAGTVAKNVLEYGTGAINVDGCRVDGGALGRWPANLIHDGSDEVLACFPDGSARYFYCAKASKADRGEGNTHPTVKPTELMRYLVRLVTPPEGVVLDPFMGSGSTGLGAALEGFGFIGIEMSAEYAEIARARIAAAEREAKDEADAQRRAAEEAARQPSLFDGAAE